jgi:beta-hydroxylase
LYLHRAHHSTDELRAVLFVDFERLCRLPMRWINRLILAVAPFTATIQRSKINHDQWEKDYYGDA